MSDSWQIGFDKGETLLRRALRGVQPAKWLSNKWLTLSAAARSPRLHRLDSSGSRSLELPARDRMLAARAAMTDAAALRLSIR